MPAAYHAGSALDAEAQLTVLARELDKTRPSSAKTACARARPRP